MTPPLITLEEHYLSSDIRKTLKDDPYTHFPQPMIDKLTSLDTTRLKDMENNKISLQVISHGPINASPSQCRTANDQLASACSSQPRFRAFAMLPMSDPPAAAAELTRCIKTHNFVGALINNHHDGNFYDAEFYWPVFARAQELDVPIYIHPTFAADEWIPHFKGNFPDQAATMMSMAGWSWHSETGLHVLRLWTSGLFDKFSKLKIVIGHMGEMLPYQLDHIYPMSQSWNPELKRSLETVWKENLWITTSGMFSLAPLACLLRTTAKERVLFSVDYPFSENEKGLRFIEEVEGSGLVSKEELEGICHGNAEKLLGVKALR